MKNKHSDIWEYILFCRCLKCREQAKFIAKTRYKTRYKNFTNEQKQANRAIQERIKYERREWLDKIKRETGCKYCPENEPVCLDFHHRDPSTKKDNISNLVIAATTKEKLLEEISKCDLTCANCHRKLHKGSRLLSSETALSKKLQVSA